jgi:hypothetical protein
VSPDKNVYNGDCNCCFYVWHDATTQNPSKTKIKKKKMFNKGEKVSVLDEALNGVVIAKDKEVTIETEEGFVMTFCQ